MPRRIWSAALCPPLWFFDLECGALSAAFALERKPKTKAADKAPHSKSHAARRTAEGQKNVLPRARAAIPILTATPIPTRATDGGPFSLSRFTNSRRSRGRGAARAVRRNARQRRVYR